MNKKSQKKIKILLIFVTLSIMCLASSVKSFQKEKKSTTNNTIFAYYIDGISSITFPKQNTEYSLDTSASSCTNGVVPSLDYASWTFVGDYSHYQSSNDVATRCNIYFVKNKTVSTALGELSVYPYTPDFTKSACDDEACESHEKGIYQMSDDDGTSYYYRGSVENNYVEFAGLWWRIVRINGDGTIRLIYDGTTSHTNGESSTDRYYNTTKFNEEHTDNMYTGYMYTNEEAHGLGTSSTIKQMNDTFYESRLTDYTEYIDTNNGFCGDRSTLNLQSGVGTGTITTYNKGYLRITTSSPTLTCEESNDYYTVNSSSKGNKALTYPIGLITVDEVMLAGHSGGAFDGSYNYQKSSPNSYLTIGQKFWTMTPLGGYNSFNFTSWDTLIATVEENGLINDYSTTVIYAIRPVINLKANLTFTGNGTISSPYKLSE